MLFSSPFFLFVFLPATLLGYFLAGRQRNGVVLAASLFFYAWGEPRFVAVVILSALADWLLGRVIFQSEDEIRRKRCLALGVALNLALLVYFKYVNFFVGNVNDLFAALHLRPFAFTAIALPLGVSFIVFEKITYVVDIYRKTGRPAPTLASYLLYVFFFPKLLAGPIIKYHEIAEQLDKRDWTWNDVKVGVIRFSVGMAKKALIADTLAGVVDDTFKLRADQLGFHNAWLGLLCFTLQIYFDFSGYSDMAVGLARILGFRLLENFNAPYIAANFTDFWRRWHISLSTWIREYLYFPLGGNRVSTPRTYFNLWFCFFLSGLWHGAKWTFVLWGVYHGCFLILDKLFWLRVQRRLPSAVNTALTFALVMVSWAIFRADSLAQSAYYLRALVPGLGSPDTFLYVGGDIWFYITVGLALSFLPALKYADRRRPQIAPFLRERFVYAGEASLAFSLALLVLSISKISSSTFNPFLYFRF